VVGTDPRRYNTLTLVRLVEDVQENGLSGTKRVTHTRGEQPCAGNNASFAPSDLLNGTPGMGPLVTLPDNNGEKP
jgi:hypothetical protein